MNKKLPMFVVAASACLIYVAMSTAAPKPAMVAPTDVWQLELELHGAPQPIQITLPGDTQPKTYWYLLYTVINNTGKDIEFYPEFDLFTDTFKSFPADVKPRNEVFEAIRRQYERTIPLLEPGSNVSGPILQGKDNARDSVAVFPDFDPKARTVRIFVAGLSNENISVTLPDNSVDPKTQKPKQILLSKSLMLEYQVPGDNQSLAQRSMLYRGREWVMR